VPVTAAVRPGASSGTCAGKRGVALRLKRSTVRKTLAIVAVVVVSGLCWAARQGLFRDALVQRPFIIDRMLVGEVAKGLTYCLEGHTRVGAPTGERCGGAGPSTQASLRSALERCGLSKAALEAGGRDPVHEVMVANGEFSRDGLELLARRMPQAWVRFVAVSDAMGYLEVGAPFGPVADDGLGSEARNQYVVRVRFNVCGPESGPAVRLQSLRTERRVITADWRFQLTELYDAVEAPGGPNAAPGQ
jgi:hypothetical protein